MTGDPVREAVQELAARFWSWRALRKPRSRDDIQRIRRPIGWAPDWSAEAVAASRRELAAFEADHDAIDVHGAAVADLVDHALLGSALARVNWELDILASWRRHPGFYVDQSLGEVFDGLLRPAPFDAARSAELVRLLGHVRHTLDQGRTNLAGHAVSELARLAAGELEHVEEQLSACAAELALVVPETMRSGVVATAADAGAALAEYRDWLLAELAGMQPFVPVGEQGLRWFLSEVALVPFSPAELLDLARTEHARAVTLSTVEATRPRPPAADPTFSDVAAQIERQAADEAAVRAFYVDHGILSQPATLGHYLVAELPAYLEPIAWLGTADDLTSEDRLDENGIGYTPAPGPDLSYFYAVNARDPRAGIVHEGVHYQQLALSWRHPDPVRRHYYDSVPNEGIAFYNEEMMLRAGLFDDRPTTREAILSFMGLRALRVEVDVRLALGDLTIEEAEELFVRAVPMDRATAAWETAFYGAMPAQALTYQVGKSQIERFLADAVRVQGDEFELRSFHDYLWLNGNVPIALLRLELLGLDDEWRRVLTERERRSGGR